MKDIPETEFIPTISDNEQLYDAYPELFEKLNISSATNIYFEKPNPKEKDLFAKEDRILLLPSGIISVTTKDLNHLWSITEKDKELIGKFNLSAEEFNRERIDGKLNSLFKTTVIEGREYGINYYPYNDASSNAAVLDSLEKKILSLRGIPSR